MINFNTPTNTLQWQIFVDGNNFNIRNGTNSVLQIYKLSSLTTYNYNVNITGSLTCNNLISNTLSNYQLTNNNLGSFVSHLTCGVNGTSIFNTGVVDAYDFKVNGKYEATITIDGNFNGSSYLIYNTPSNFKQWKMGSNSGGIFKLQNSNGGLIYSITNHPDNRFTFNYTVDASTINVTTLNAGNIPTNTTLTSTLSSYPTKAILTSTLLSYATASSLDLKRDIYNASLYLRSTSGSTLKWYFAQDAGFTDDLGIYNNNAGTITKNIKL
jgi:hypothetical protein